jgi:hypothetical protein
MKLKIEKFKHILFSFMNLLIVFLILIGYTYISYLLLTIVQVLFLLYLLKKRYVFTAFFLFFIYDVFFVIFLKLIVFGMEVTSWRKEYANSLLIDQSLLVIAIFLVIFNLITILNYKEKTISKDIIHYKVNKLIIIYFIFSITVLIVYFVNDFTIAIQGKLYWLEHKYKFPYFEIFEMIAISSAIFRINFKIKNIYTNIIFYSTLLLSLVLFMLGFRSIIIPYVLLYLYQYIKENYISYKTYFKIFIGTITLYIFMSIQGLLRKGKDLSYLANDFGNHEENIFFTLAGIIDKDVTLHGLSYVASLARLLPSFITGDISDSFERVSKIIAFIVIPNYKESDIINMGAFIISEIYLNFSILGSIILAGILALLFTNLEKAQNYFSRIILLLILSNLFTLVHYGSSNFFKIFFYEVVFLLMLNFTLIKSRKGNY